MSSTMINIQNLCFGYEDADTELFHNLNLSVPSHKTLVLLGPNGAGKTSLLRLLLNLSKPQSGKIEILGFTPGAEKLQKQIAFLCEQPTRYDFLNLNQYLNFFSTMNKVSAEVRNPQARQLVANIDPNIPMKNYSKGMMQRLNFARLLLNDPELIFLDEPSTGLDPIGHLKIEEMVLGLKKQGKSIFLNTHNLDFALNVADQIVIMNMGKIIIEVDRLNTDRKALQEIFLNLESERS